MTKPKFTKEEWLIAGDHFVYALNDKGVNVFCCNVQDCHTDTIELKANAHLIAAAPDMYKLLDDMLKNHEFGNFIDVTIYELLKKARGEHNGS